MPIITVDPVEMSYLDAVWNSVIEEMQNIQLARDYFNGKHDTSFMSDRVKEFLNLHSSVSFRLNVCQGVVQALANELELIGLDTSETQDANGNKLQAEWAAELFKANDIASLQTDVHEAALADRETYIIVEYDTNKGYAVFTHNPRLVTVEAGGDGMGAVIVYQNDDIHQDPEYAVKEWIDTEYDSAGNPRTTKRRTVYYADRIERFVYDYGWKHFEEKIVNEDGVETLKPWPEPWVKSDGTPIGISVAHFPNKSLTAEHWEAIPPQDAINKTLVDVLAANDLTAFKSFFGFGFYPTKDNKVPKSDGSNLMKIGPAQFNGTTKLPSEASLQEIEGADNTPLMESLKDLVMFVAQITDTPVTRFITSAQIASSETIMAQKQALRDKAKNRRARFGGRWVQCFEIARILENIYGELTLDETVTFTPLWRSDKTLEEIADKVSKLKITQKQAWKEAGYTTAEIEEMAKDPEYLFTFFDSIFTGYDKASQQGIPFEAYLRMINLPDDTITMLVAAQGKATLAISQ
jgi:hypothetical protein